MYYGFNCFFPHTFMGPHKIITTIMLKKFILVVSFLFKTRFCLKTFIDQWKKKNRQSWKHYNQLVTTNWSSVIIEKLSPLLQNKSGTITNLKYKWLFDGFHVIDLRDKLKVLIQESLKGNNLSRIHFRYTFEKLCNITSTNSYFLF